MTYQTPELIAKQVIDRLSASQVEAVGIWIHTAHLSSQNKHPRKMNMLAHLLMPLTQNAKCRPFFLSNNDILLVGTSELSNTVIPIIEQMKQVLSDDPFITQNAASFYTVFNIRTQKELLISGLSTLSCKTKETSIIPQDLYPLIQETLTKNDVVDFLNYQAVLHLTPQTKKQIFNLCTPDINSLLHTTIADTSVIPDWVKDEYKYKVLSHILEANQLPRTSPLPLLMPMNASDVDTAAFDFFMERQQKPCYPLFYLSDILINSCLITAQKKCHARRSKWGFILEHITQLSLIDLTKIKPDFIVLPGTNLMPDLIPSQLKKETVLLAGIESDTDLFNALRAGFTLFQGPLINMILGASCQTDCPYGDTCPPQSCTHIMNGQVPVEKCVFPKFRSEYIFSQTGES